MTSSLRERLLDRLGDVAAAPAPGAARQPTPAMLLGLRGERIAERYLREKGWRVLQRRFRSGHRDVDLIVERRGTVAFVEVKTRTGTTFGSPVDAVNWFKQRQLVKSAHVWVSRFGRSQELYRFDVVGVWILGDRVRVRHVEGAFELPARNGF
ncbi:MAG: YraN family protein [Gemmatimonadaceae bacterium]|nr:YraN family protein [Gemmatimonadaceae bacterium]